MRSLVLTALLALAVSGCSLLGPNYKRPAVDLPAGYSEANGGAPDQLRTKSFVVA